MHAVCCARPKELQADVENDAHPYYHPSAVTSAPTLPLADYSFLRLTQSSMDWHIPFFFFFFFSLSICAYFSVYAAHYQVIIFLSVLHVLLEFFTSVMIFQRCVNA